MEIPEKYWEKRNIGHRTKKRLKKIHVPYIAGFSITSNREIKRFEPIMIIIRRKDYDHDLMKEFGERMAKKIKGIHDKNFRFVVPMKMTREDMDDYIRVQNVIFAQNGFIRTVTGHYVRFWITVILRESAVDRRTAFVTLRQQNRTLFQHFFIISMVMMNIYSYRVCQ